ncbi:vancomycin permeability regulator SanA [Pullulanibacillus pueri]|uniref:DUF218 domain-containing protein n=1 Tax=Pullulanibacillus pueri TaxID=1437324 RepID=A0A8J3ENU7_9BACL|nr:YdcF family protein [Pullulanibacillus pueri]MBM7683649.1 vancomycin permeability regulator SanA [Pullulanibacillus pueri]GGH87225.1 hypothetical protein GCM10007096_36750 [Pullulanibacillus pueri]
MKISQLEPEHLTQEQITQLIFNGLEDDQKNGDCIMVFGSSLAHKYRLPKAIELYQHGRAGKLLFSGGVTWKGNAHPEAICLKERALELGIPEKDILIETLSKHTKENVLASLLVLDRAFNLHHIKRLLVVTTRYHIKRAYLTLKTYMPDWIEFSLCPVDDQLTQEAHWFLTPKGYKRVETEAKKLIQYVQQGVIVDDEV